MTTKRKNQIFIATVLMFIVLFCMFGCSVKKQVEEKEEKKEENKDKIEKIIAEHREENMKLSVELLKSSNEMYENTIISPLAVQMAMGFAINGAKGVTQSSIIDAVGMETAVLNDYLKTYIEEAPKDVRGNINFVNAIWLNAINTGLDLNSSYKDRVTEYLNAEVKQEPFSMGCENVINEWASEATDQMVNKVVRKVDTADWFYTFNIATFDMDWETTYSVNDIEKKTFNNAKNTTSDAEMMSSVESLYIEDNGATGFIKNYYIPRYQFVAILPDEKTTLEEYVNNLDYRKLIKLLESADKINVKATIPSFVSYKTVDIRKTLMGIGLGNLFRSDADFSGMLKEGMATHLGEMYHTSTVTVGKKSSEGVIISNVADKNNKKNDYDKEVILDRPFLYMIFDSEESIPIFIGTMKNI